MNIVYTIDMNILIVIAAWVIILGAFLLPAFANYIVFFTLAFMVVVFIKTTG
jgi:hypothetical protein